MVEIGGTNRPLVQEILDTLLLKFEELPIDDRNLIVIASIEAIAWIAAMECETFAENSIEEAGTAHRRFADYNYLFTIAGNNRLNGATNRDNESI
ncbi:MAG: hypothetical protein KUG56_03740 [Kordiimonadaceae bacterium]|nr:hypothetical protein [Kordiimonadaceae bacterium]